jgi:hypothetical protein
MPHSCASLHIYSVARVCPGGRGSNARRAWSLEKRKNNRNETTQKQLVYQCCALIT